MTKYEQSDGFVPNKQTPPATSKIGASDAKWDEINATTVAATTLTKGGATVPSIYSELVDLPALTNVVITHSLSNSNPMVIVYGSGSNDVLPIGSGAGTVIYAVSGASADIVHLRSTVGAPGSTVVIIG